MAPGSSRAPRALNEALNHSQWRTWARFFGMRPSEGLIYFRVSVSRRSPEYARIKFPGVKRTVIDGPFAETKELITGYWIIQVKSREEAIEWAKRVPAPHEGQECEIEIRQFFEMDDFGPSGRSRARARQGAREEEVVRFGSTLFA